MGKLLILIAIVVGIIWLTRSGRGSRADVGRRPAADERMVPCAHCGVYLPVGEAIATGNRYYCSEEHRRLSAG